MSFDGGIYKPVLKEKISSKEFASLSQHQQANIKHAKFNVPTLGKKGFGFFDVEYNTPILRREGKCV